MSLYIDAATVQAVLLADGWHEVTAFDLDSYEFHSEDVVIHAGGHSGISATGFQFTETNEAGDSEAIVSGPLSSVLAVRHSA